MTDELGPAGQGPFAPRARARRCASIAEAHRRVGNDAAAAEWQGLADGWTAFAERQEAREASMNKADRLVGR